MSFQIKLLETLRTDSFLKIYESICDAPDMSNYMQNESQLEAEAMKQCIDPSYVDYVDKMRNVLVREHEVYCSKKFQIIEVAKEIQNVNSSICLNDNAFRIVGCLFSPVGVRDMIQDKNLVSKFTMSLLDGNDKECGVIEEIKKCMVETTDTCKDNSLAIIIKHFFGSTMETFGCNVQLCKEFAFKNFDLPLNKC